MRTIFSTADVPAAQRFDYWQDVVASQFRRRKVMAFDRRNFYADIQVGALGDLGLVSCRASPLITSPGAGSDEFLLVLPSSPVHLDFARHSFATNRSDAYLIDAREPHLVAHSREPIDRTLLRIPSKLLGGCISANVTNRPLPLRGDVALLVAFVRDIVRAEASGLSPTMAWQLPQLVRDLIVAAIGQLTGVTPRLEAASRFETLKLRVAIDSQLTNPNANPASIAAAAGLSERHANRLLAQEEGTSIHRLLTERRLLAARTALSDPLQAHRRIGDIARAFGFPNRTHFAVVFRNRFGLTPGEYRSRTFASRITT